MSTKTKKTTPPKPRVDSFLDPYDDIPVDNRATIQARVSHEDAQVFRILTKRKGHVQTSLSLFLHHIATEARKQNLQDYNDQPKLERIVLDTINGTLV